MTVAGELSTNPNPNGGGYICSRCRQWVPDGTIHACNMTTVPVNGITFGCLYGGHHDYAVGPTHAVCNRCDKVVKL